MTLGENLEKAIYRRELKMGEIKKYELTSETKVIYGKTLFRIKALISFASVKAGELGGFIEKEENLDHKGNAWVYGNAKVYGNAEVYGNAWVCGDAKVCGNADYATVKGFGSCFRCTTFFRCKDKMIRVVCGCFYGTIYEFREKVRETHKDTKIAKEYLMIADLMEMHFAEE